MNAIIMQIMRDQAWINDYTGKGTAKSKKGLADALNIDPSGVTAIINGNRSIKADEILTIARYLELSTDMVYSLVSGDTFDHLEPIHRHIVPKTKEIPVLGYIGAGDEVNLLFDDFAPGDGMYTVKTPPECSDRAVGLEVKGNSMFPAYDEGDIVFYERDGQTSIDQRCIGRQSIVKLVDGRIYLKRLSLGSEKGMYTLESFNAPPIQNVDVEWSALVKYVQKKY